MVSTGTITYWCYMTSVIMQGVTAMGFMMSPHMVVPWATDNYAQFFIRVTGITLLSLVQVFWRFRHVPFAAQGSVGAQLAAFSLSCGRLFVRFHYMMAMFLFWIMFNVGLKVPNGKFLLSLHLMWASIMSYALLMHQRVARGHIIDTTSLPAAATSVQQLVVGDNPPQHRTVMQMIQGDNSSSKSVLGLF